MCVTLPEFTEFDPRPDLYHEWICLCIGMRTVPVRMGVRSIIQRGITMAMTPGLGTHTIGKYTVKKGDLSNL